MRRICVECGGPNVCEHKKLRNFCVLCGGKHVCMHGKSKYSCRACKKLKKSGA
jgi:hypothetical protein